MKSFLIKIFATVCAAMVLQTSLLAQAPELSRVWVQFAPGQKAGVQAALQRAGSQVHYEFDQLNAIAASIPAQALDGISRNPAVVLVEEDPIREMSGEVVPYGVPLVDAPVILGGAEYAGSGLKVGVIDSGIFAAHEDFAGLPLSGNGLNGTTLGWDADGCGHGTHVVGTIAAASGNSKGIVGVAPGVSIHMVRVFGDNCGWAYSSSLVDAAQKCVSAGSKIINMSLGGSTPSATEQTALDQLYAQGVLLIAAAGNSGTTAYSYPASYSSVISVGAVDSDKNLASFSQRNNQVELVAPGVGVLSTVPFISGGLTVDGQAYVAEPIERSKVGTASGLLVSGGTATSVNQAWKGKVVLVERGGNTFADKVSNVQKSGGVAAIIYNNEPGSVSGTLGQGKPATIPAVTITQADGLALLGKEGAPASVSTVSATGSGYASYNGTSMSTPHVAGVAALVWSTDPSRTHAEVRAALQQTALDLGQSGRDNSYGFGLVQAQAAANLLPNVDIGGGGGSGGGGGGGGGEEGSAPLITDVSSLKTHNNGTFEITWTTDIASDSEVQFTQGASGTFSDPLLVTSHKMVFRGANKVRYGYYVRSKAGGPVAESGPFYHQN